MAECLDTERQNYTAIVEMANVLNLQHPHHVATVQMAKGVAADMANKCFNIQHPHHVATVQMAKGVAADMAKKCFNIQHPHHVATVEMAKKVFYHTTPPIMLQQSRWQKCVLTYNPHIMLQQLRWQKRCFNIQHPHHVATVEMAKHF